MQERHADNASAVVAGLCAFPFRRVNRQRTPEPDAPKHPDWARRPNLGYSLATLLETFESDSSSYRELSRLCEEPICAFH
jgi:hypothetical protein